jgi:Relaxase/Mobilisation nuclease domain
MPSGMANERLFDLVSYARRGPGRRDHLSPGEIAQVARTVRRTPEVMVKVLSRGGQDLKAVGRHLDYLRLRDEGELGLETDDGQRLMGDNATQDLVESWDLDLEEHRRRSELDARGGGSTKLVHKLLFSMPAGTPPNKVLAAVKNFAREEFGLKHRYAMVLHTDEPHPHVHMVVKAVSERGVRLHIRKATLRDWRREFAKHLRELGVEANATDRAVRGVTQPRKLDGIYRAAHDEKRKRYSTHMRSRVETVARELGAGGVKVEAGKLKLVGTRREVERGWLAVSDILAGEGQRELAAQVRHFVHQMPPAVTEKEWIAQALLDRARQPQTKEKSVAR